MLSWSCEERRDKLASLIGVFEQPYASYFFITAALCILNAYWQYAQLCKWCRTTSRMLQSSRMMSSELFSTRVEAGKEGKEQHVFSFKRSRTEEKIEDTLKKTWVRGCTIEVIVRCICSDEASTVVVRQKYFLPYAISEENVVALERAVDAISDYMLAQQMLAQQLHFSEVTEGHTNLHPATCTRKYFWIWPNVLPIYLNTRGLLMSSLCK